MHPHVIIAADIVKRGHSAAFYAHQSAHQFAAAGWGWLLIFALAAAVALIVSGTRATRRRSQPEQ